MEQLIANCLLVDIYYWGIGVGTETVWCPVAQLQLCHLVHLTRLEI